MAVSGNFTAADQVTDSISHNINDGQVVAVVSGTFVGAVDLQISIDGVNWVGISNLSAGGLMSTVFTFGAVYRLYCTAWTSGTIAVKLL